jgi:NAD-dependent dihydropyrimidine dehydrogenase PreA subunit
MPSRRQLIFGAFLRTEPTSSPETAGQLPNAGPRIVAFAEHCLAQQNVVCRSCAEICEHDAIRFSPRLGGAALPVLNHDRCTGCGDCLPICPNAALSLVANSSAPSLTRNPEEFAA